MGKIREIMELIAEEAPKSEKVKDSVKKWISTYDGKVVGFRVNGSIQSSKWAERFHLIIYFKNDNLIMKVRDGDYPSPEVIFVVINEADGLEMFINPGILTKLIRSQKIWMMANMNDGLQFSSSVISRDPELAKKIADKAA